MECDDEEFTDHHLSCELSIEEIGLSTWKDLYKFIYYKVQNKQEAEDVTQETYLKAIDYIERKNPKIDNYLGYFKVMALNIIRDNWRKNKKIGNVIQLDKVNPENYKTEDFTSSIVNQEWLKKGLLSLNFDQRRVIELRIIKGFSVAEAARILNKSEENIRVIQYRALKILSKRFSQQEL